MAQPTKQDSRQFKNGIADQTGWPLADLLNRVIDPLETLTDNDLQQELDFYANAQFRYSPSHQIGVSTTATDDNPNYMDMNNSHGHPQPRTFRSHSEAYNHHTLRNLSMLLDQQQRRSSANMDVLLGHESNLLNQNINTQQQMNTLYTSNPVTANQPVHHLTAFASDPMEETDQISSLLPFSPPAPSTAKTVDPPTPVTPKKKTTQKAPLNQQMQFRFRPDQPSKSNQENTKSDRQKKNKNKPLDVNMLTEHNLQQEMTATRTITLGETTFTFTIDSLLNTNKQKEKKKESARRHSKAEIDDAMDEDGDDDMNSDHQDSDKDEEEPVIGDGALSFSSIGSNNSLNSQRKSTLTKDDKRKRNTAASARFRIKKKMKEQALQKTACEMTEKAQMMESRVHELEREIKWLKALVVERNESTLEKLIRDRPLNSVAFPLSQPSSSRYNNQDIEEENEEDDYSPY